MPAGHGPASGHSTAQNLRNAKARNRRARRANDDDVDENSPTAKCICLLCCLPCIVIDALGRLCQYDRLCPAVADQCGAPGAVIFSGCGCCDDDDASGDDPQREEAQKLYYEGATRSRASRVEAPDSPLAGVNVQEGRGVPKDLAEAERLFKLAAEKGSKAAEAELAKLQPAAPADVAVVEEQPA